MRWIKTKEVCEMLNISRATLYRLIERGDIIRYKVGGTNRFLESEILTYLEECKS